MGRVVTFEKKHVAHLFLRFNWLALCNVHFGCTVAKHNLFTYIPRNCNLQFYSRTNITFPKVLTRPRLLHCTAALISIKGILIVWIGILYGIYIMEFFLWQRNHVFSTQHSSVQKRGIFSPLYCSSTHWLITGYITFCMAEVHCFAMTLASI